MFCAIWYHLCNLKNVKITHGRKTASLLKKHSSMVVFSRFLNCTNGTKLRNDSHNGHSSEISVMSSLKYKFNVLFISILKLLVIFVSSSQSYLLTKWLNSCLSWLEKISRIPKLMIFNSKIITLYTFYIASLHKNFPLIHFNPVSHFYTP